MIGSVLVFILTVLIGVLYAPPTATRFASSSLLAF